jgi:ABC-type uncharacterized transport system auxiliary subunit
MMNALALLTIPICALATIGCFATAKVPVVQHYRLDYVPQATERTPLPVVLRLSSFRTAAAYARSGIIYREGGHGIDTYPNRRWIADPGRMITDLLVRDLASSGLFRAVEQSPSRLQSDYIISGEIEEIEEVAASECAARLKIRVLLANASRENSPDSVLFQKSFTHNEPSRCTDIDDLVTAMSRALANISQQLQSDVYAAIVDDRGD